MKTNINLVALLYIVHPTDWTSTAFSIGKSRACISKRSFALKSTSLPPDASIPPEGPNPLYDNPGGGGAAGGGPGKRDGDFRSAGDGGSASLDEIADLRLTRNIWDTSLPVRVQGGALRTWSLTSPYVERVQVLLKTDGRVGNANIELWHGPDNTPQKVGVYMENGDMRNFCAVIETPRGHNAVAIRNTGEIEFPIEAHVEADVVDRNTGTATLGLGSVIGRLTESAQPGIVQGGAVRTWPFDYSVASVQVNLRTDGRPMNARIELLQGPNNIKQVMEIYTEDGMDRPFFAILETPGSGNVVRIVNTAPVEFPLSACVEPFLVDSSDLPPPSSMAGGGIVLDAR